MHSAAGGTNWTLPSWPALKAALKARAWPIAELSAPYAGLSGPIGPMLYYFPQLSALELGGNQLTGAVPADLGNGTAKKMFYLGLAGNKLRGEPPVACGGWLAIVPLQLLTTRHNSRPLLDADGGTALPCAPHTPGTLPSTLAAGFALGPNNSSSLDLSYNQLSGTLPAAWGTAGGAFRQLSLAGNYITGSLPASWAALAINASGFDLSSNYLNGSLPAGFSTPPAALSMTGPDNWWVA